MKSPVFLICALAIAANTFAYATTLAAAPDAAAVADVVQRYLASANREAELNRESVEGGQTVVADLDGDGNAEIVLLTTLLGGTYWNYSVTVFTDRGKGHVAAASTDTPLGMVDSIAVKDGSIHVSAKWPAPNDARCCPSVQRTTAYAWQGNKLVETQPGANHAATVTPAAKAPAAESPGVGWELRTLPDLPPLATTAGPGVVQSLSLLCNENLPVAAFVLKAKPPPGPVVVGLEAGGQRVQLPLTQPASGGMVWYGDLRNSTLPRFLAANGGNARLTINQGQQGQLSLQGAGAAARAALSGCYRF